ncbi:hypothetical protein STEG23_035277 [Scotinomys teguina]
MVPMTPMATQAMDINPKCSRTMDSDIAISSMLGSDVTMALGGSMNLSDQYGPSKCGPWTSTWPHMEAMVQPLMILEVMDLNTDLDYYMATNPEYDPWPQLRPDVIMAPGGSMGHPDLFGPGVNMTLGYQHGIRLESSF